MMANLGNFEFSPRTTMIPETPKEEQGKAMSRLSKRRRVGSSSPDIQPVATIIISDDEEDSEVIGKKPQSKKAHRIVDSDEDDLESVQELEIHSKNTIESGLSSSEDENADAAGPELLKLIDVFPDREPQYLKRVLDNNDGNVQIATQAVLDNKEYIDSPVQKKRSRLRPVESKPIPSKFPKKSSSGWLRTSSVDGDGKHTIKKKKSTSESKKKKKPKKKFEDSEDDDEPVYSDDFSEGSSGEADVASLDIEDMEAALKWFNSSSLAEMEALKGCGTLKAKIILKHRPFASFDELVEFFEETPRLSSEIVFAFKDYLTESKTILSVLKKCFSASEAVRKSTDSQVLNFEPPKLLSEDCKLRSFQEESLEWMKRMHQAKFNMILADEMGLGKTIQAIAFLAYLFSEEDAKMAVIIVPSSVLDNWARELSIWLPSLKVAYLHGSQKERLPLIEEIRSGYHDYRIVLTTYNVAMSNECRFLNKRGNKFKCAVFDEGHMLKNCKSERYRKLTKISSERRLVLTGTPLQNNLLELMSLLVFTLPDMFQESSDSEGASISHILRFFSQKCAPEDSMHNQMLSKAKAIMEPFVLRRTKEDVLKDLPDKIVKVDLCDLDGKQQSAYKSIVENWKRAITEAEEAKKDGVKNVKTLGNVVMQLRKIANHPLLHRIHYDDSTLHKMTTALMTKEDYYRDNSAELIFEDMTVMSDYELHGLCKEFPRALKEFKMEDNSLYESCKIRKLKELLKANKSAKDRVLVFSQFMQVLDILELFLKAEGYKYLRLDGSTSVDERQTLIDKYNKDEDIFVFLLSTRAGGLGINLTAANTVILHDIDWNPQQDKQAEARCHRVGQTRSVTVTKLVAKDTIEEVMLKRAQDKLLLDEEMVDAKGLTQDEMKQLLLQSCT
eukprot:m.52509 g.52509  ORF g.52509 m.52509 type:complete len:898 (+) comp10797_c0_seq3:163-2856(+)